MVRQVAAAVLVLFFTIAVPLVGHSIEIDRAVVDTVGVLSHHEIEGISDRLHRHHEATGVQMAVVIVETVRPQTIEDFTLQLAERWEGGHRDRSDGVILLLALRDRESRLEVGYGLEALIPDSYARRVLDDAIPSLQREAYAAAIHAVIFGVMARTEHLEPGAPIRRGVRSFVGLILAMLFVLATALGFFWQRSRNGLFAGESDRWATLAKEAEELTDEDIEKMHFSAFPVRLIDGVWWVLPPLLIAFVFRDQGYWLPFGLLWLGAAIFSAVMASAFPRSIYGAVAVALSIPYGWVPLFLLANANSADVTDYLLLATVATVAVVAAGGVLLFMTYAQEHNQHTYASSGYFGDSSWQEQGTHSSASSFRSDEHRNVGGVTGVGSAGWRGSSASSRGTSTRSSSGSSYRGGGGRFGGGGATSRW